MTTNYRQDEKKFIALWKELATKSPYDMPFRGQLVDDVIDDYLPSLVILDYNGQTFIVTHTGSVVISFYQHDLTGMDYFDFYSKEARKHIITLFDEMKHCPFAYYVERDFYKADGHRLHSKTISLPFADENGEFVSIFSLTNAQSDTPKEPAKNTDVTGQSAIVRKVEFIDLGYGLPDEEILTKVKKLILIETID